MSNYYQEYLNSESTEDNSYDSEEGQGLDISTLDYEKLDSKYQKNKRPHELSETFENSNIKKIKIDNPKEKNKNTENDTDDDDYLITCPICLESFLNKTLLDPCYHAFCNVCIKKWSKVSQNCPLCKRHYDFAIYNIKDEYTYDKIYFGEGEIQHQKPKRKEIYPRNHQYSYPSLFSLSNNKNNKDGIDYRSKIYTQGLYSKQPEKYKVLKESQTYLEYLTKYKAKFDRIIPWVERDIKAILHTDEIDLIRDFILRIIKRYDLDSEEAMDEISLFLKDKTNHFIYELKGFINSPFNIQTYDRETQYEKKSDHKIPFEAVKDYYLTQQKLKEKEK
ncbi:hypothetical protein BCR36DRAFT_584604 [Piromyces finnis]|uniref:RING-type E3 ubiquitin transferase n=1 Tax=Piromyces finnis TaxID=1754191 RepID=A0A1Y1V5R1_9FUNG|nr:hypothetical protein BCR36DRAFT_584604 [Piromyces finnis]|eukprot:ORX47908.1 hypothetical protein BCR36DRAFT_584604 [Piromyces finnis]